MDVPTLTVTAPTRAFLDYLTREREVTLAPGTRLRWLELAGLDPVLLEDTLLKRLQE